MSTRRTVGVFFGLKVGLFLSCFFLLFAHRLFAQLWFKLGASKSAIKSAILEATNVDVRNKQGATGLMFAAYTGDPWLAQALIASGADLHLKAVVYGDTALHYACWASDMSKYRAIVRLLLKNGVHVRVTNDNGDTPLHFLLYVGNLNIRLELFRTLLKHGADINAQNKLGNTIMHRAVNMRNKQWIKILLENFESLLDLSLRNKDEMTPLDYAESLKYDNVVQVLNKARLKRLDKPNERDSNGLTSLMLAVMRNDMPAAQALIKAGSDLNARSRGIYKYTPLHLAVLYENIPMIQLLLDSGASRISLNNNRDIPLHFVVRVADNKKQTEIAKLLLGNDPKVTINTQNINGNTLLHLAVMNNEEELVAYLLDNYGSQLNTTIKNKALRTPGDLARLLHRIQIDTMLKSAKR